MGTTEAENRGEWLLDVCDADSALLEAIYSTLFDANGETALCPPRFDEALNEIDNCRAVWATISQVAHEYESSAIGMLPVAVVAKMSNQRAQRVNFTVDIAN